MGKLVCIRAARRNREIAARAAEAEALRLKCNAERDRDAQERRQRLDDLLTPGWFPPPPGAA